MRLSALILATFALIAVQNGPSLSAASPNGSPQSDFHARCVRAGGTDLTDKGTLKLTGGAKDAVICQKPATQAASSSNAQRSAAPLDGFFYGQATAYAPSGNATVSAENTVFPTSCSVVAYIPAEPSFPAVSNGNSTFNCRGYNVKGKSAGCDIQWTGVTPIPVGTNTTIEEDFTCIATKAPASIGSAIDYSYADPTYQRIIFSASGTGTISVSLQ